MVKVEDIHGLEFQKFAHDRSKNFRGHLADEVPDVASARRGSLTPGAFHAQTGDKTLSFELEQALRGLEKLLDEA